MPLLPPDRIQKGKRRTRVEVLLDTVKRWQGESDRCTKLAHAANARRR